MRGGRWPAENPFTLPRFEPLYTSTEGSRHRARLKVHLARLQLEAEEKAQSRDTHVRLEIHKLEIEADKAVRLREVELESQRMQQAASVAAASGMPHPV